MTRGSKRSWARGLPVALLVAAALLGACKKQYKTTPDVTAHGDDVVYLRDERTGLCFALLALQNPAGTSIQQITMTDVPCERLEGVETR